MGLVFLLLFEAKKKTESLEHKIHLQYINWSTREVNHMVTLKHIVGMFIDLRSEEF